MLLISPARRLTLLWAALAAMAGAQAQTPAPATTPATLMVGFAAGGTSDAVARLLAEKLPDVLGRPVIVENKPGAIGTLAIRETIAAGEKPVFVVVPFSSLLLPVLTMPSIRYDVFKDLQPVAGLTSFPLGVVVSASTGIKTPPELVAWLRQNPSKASFGTAGAGGHNHFLSLQLGKAIGVPATVVPYKGNAPLITDLIPGHLPAGMMVAGEVTPQLKEGRIVLVGVLTPKRSPLMPDVPTFVEHGIPVDSGEAWYGMWASSRLPKAEVERMQEGVRKVLAMPEVRDALASRYSMSADYRSAEQAGRRLQADNDYWAPVIKASGFKAE